MTDGVEMTTARMAVRTSIKELAEMVAEIGHKKVVVDLPSDKEKAGYNVVAKSVFSTDKLKQLGWEALPATMKEKMRSTIIYRQQSCNS